MSDDAGLVRGTGRFDLEAVVVVGYGMLAARDAARAVHRPLP